MPASTRQQSEAEERAATAAALEAAEEQAAQAAAAERAAQDALGLERLAREEAEKAQAALEKRLAELESGFESAGSEEEATVQRESVYWTLPMIMCGGSTLDAMYRLLGGIFHGAFFGLLHFLLESFIRLHRHFLQHVLCVCLRLLLFVSAKWLERYRSSFK